MNTENGTENSQRARIAVQAQFYSNPEVAKKIAEKNGIDYDEVAERYFMQELIPVSGSRHNYPANLGKVFTFVVKKEAFLARLADKLPLLRAWCAFDLLIDVPDLYAVHHDQVMDLIIFRQLDYFIERLIMQPARDKILGDSVDYFNAHWQEKGLSDEQIGRIALKIDNAFSNYNEPAFNDKIKYCFRLVTLNKYHGVSNDCDLSDLLSGLSESEKSTLIQAVVKSLTKDKKYLDAAEVAGRFELRELQIVVAGLAYDRCFERNQFEEAAEIALKYNILDYRESSKIALEKMKQGGDLLINSIKVINWAAKFDLTLSDSDIKGFYQNCDPETLLKVGCRIAAQDRAIILMDEQNPAVDYLANYFGPDNLYFTDEEAMVLIIHHLTSGKITEEILPVIFDCKKWLLAKWPRQVMINQFVFEWIYQASDKQDKIVSFVDWCGNGLFSGPFCIDLPVLVQKAVDLALDRGDWFKYKTICQEWLPEQYAEALEIEKT